MVAIPRNEYPQFPAALSFVMLLGPQRAQTALARRAASLEARLAEIEADLAQYEGALPRVTLMDDEYEQAIISAELGWLRGVLADLKSGALTWSYEMLAGVAQYLPDVARAGGEPAG